MPMSSDVLNIAGDLIPEIDPVLDQLLQRGKTERVMILSGTETSESRLRKPYAVTHVQITFDNEDDLRKCVRLLRWSDERLRARPDQILLWEWDNSFRENMTISFAVNWYDSQFFERRRDAFMEPRHASYYGQFGAKPEDFKLRHEVLS
jgi:hypothetical protein